MSDAHAHVEEGQAIREGHPKDLPGTHHVSPEEQERHNDLDVGAIAFIFIVGTVSVIALVLALQVAYFWDENKRVEERVTSQINVNANTVLAEQRAKQAGYAWAEPDRKDVVRIPIERAMDLVVKEQAAVQNGGSGARKGF